MRSFQKILHELKEVAEAHRPGEIILPPPSLTFADLRIGRIAYVMAGEHHPAEVPPVVLLHGFGGFFMDWPRVMAPIARHTRVYALDLPGWGFSDPMQGSFEDGVVVVNEFLRKMKLSRVILAGLSFGGSLAWAAAAMHLPRVKSAVLLNPMPPHPLRFMRSPIYRGIFAMGTFAQSAAIGHRLLTKPAYKQICRENLLNDRLLDTFYLNLAYMMIKQPKTPEVLHSYARGAAGVDWNDWEHRLSSIQIPVTILQGREDRVFSLESARQLHRLIPTSQLVEVENCGHAMVFDQHRKAAEVIIQTVKKEIAEAANGSIRKKAI